MELASAYPNSAISTGAMILIAVVMAGTLVFWLVMVFVADRQRRNLSERLAAKPAAPVARPELTEPAMTGPAMTGPAVAGPDESAEDERSGAGHGHVTRQIQPAGW